MIVEIISVIFAILILFFATVIVFDCHRFVVRNFCLESEKIKGNHRFVFITDLHSKQFGRQNSTLIKAIDEEKPEAVFISGDMFTAVKKDDFGVAFSLLSDLVKKYPVFYSNGNHETKTVLRKDEFGDRFFDYKEKLSKLGVTFLNNDSRAIEGSNIRIWGLELPFEYYKKNKKYTLCGNDVEKIMSKSKECEFTLLLAHDPEYFKAYAQWKADLVLSGHFHGGLIRLPFLKGVISPRYKLFPEYTYGEYKEGESTMYLSCGLGTHTLPARLFNPGELTVVTLKEKT